MNLEQAEKKLDAIETEIDAVQNKRPVDWNRLRELARRGDEVLGKVLDMRREIGQ